MPPEKELKKLRKDLAKSRAEISALQRKLQAALLKKKGNTKTDGRIPPA
jgi:Skp family chaperone for outer membrane proteins